MLNIWSKLTWTKLMFGFSPIFPYPSISNPPLINLRRFSIYNLYFNYELIHIFFQLNKLYSKFKPSFNSNYNVDTLDDFIAYKIFKDLFGKKN